MHAGGEGAAAGEGRGKVLHSLGRVSQGGEVVEVLVVHAVEVIVEEGLEDLPLLAAEGDGRGAGAAAGRGGDEGQLGRFP